MGEKSQRLRKDFIGLESVLPLADNAVKSLRVAKGKMLQRMLRALVTADRLIRNTMKINCAICLVLIRRNLAHGRFGRRDA